MDGSAAIKPVNKPGRPAGRRCTRAHLLAAARDAFAGGGFEGSGIRKIAEAAAVTPATLLHHFPRKQALYTAVLDAVAEELLGELPPLPAVPQAKDVLDLAESLLDWTASHDREACLILRELLYNRERAANARHWPLTPVVGRMKAIVAAAVRAGAVRPVNPFTFVFQIIGAVAYFHAGLPTIARMAGASEAALAKRYRADLLANLDAMLRRPE